MLTLFSLFFENAMAAAGGHGDGIPYKTILFQLGNLTVLIAILFFFTRKKIKDHFSDRRQNFELALQRARAAKEEAEQKQKEIAAQLKELEANFESSLKKAEQKAEQNRQAMVQEAKDMAARIKAEAETTYRNEVTSAVGNLKTELLTASIEATENLLKTKMQKSDHESLQDSLMKTIGAAK